jgi:hypothetical protein
MMRRRGNFSTSAARQSSEQSGSVALKHVGCFRPLGIRNFWLRNVIKSSSDSSRSDTEAIEAVFLDFNLCAVPGNPHSSLIPVLAAFHVPLRRTLAIAWNGNSSKK